jgi:hypothetical protein
MPYRISKSGGNNVTDTLRIAKTDGLWQQDYEALEDGGRLFVRNLTIDFRGSGHPEYHVRFLLAEV